MKSNDKKANFKLLSYLWNPYILTSSQNNILNNNFNKGSILTLNSIGIKLTQISINV
jgi:uncharacterized metal-binding protein